MALRNAKVAAVLLVVLVLLLAKWLGIFARLGEPALLAQSIQGLGAWGYVAFVAAFTVLQPFGVPGTIFVVAAPLIWPWPVAFALSMTGSMGASTVGFSFARFVGRDWMAPRIPERLKRYNDALERHAFKTVFLLRLVFWMPQVLHTFLGVSKVRGSTHFWASLLGYAPPLFLMSFFGQKLFDVVKDVPVRTWLLLAVGLAALALLGLSIRRSCTVSTPARR